MSRIPSIRVMQVHLADGHEGGGGGIAMLRLHLGLRETGIDSRILCRTKTQNSPYVTSIARYPRLEYGLGRITKNLGLNDIHLVSSFGVKRENVYRNCDLIDFQGIHSQTLSYLALPCLTRDKPSVFTMHDMWALTGHCAYSYDCERWKIGCGKCPYPGTHPAVKRDNTRVEWQLKRWAYRHSNLTFSAPSTWLIELAKESIIGQFPIHHIPYGIDTEVYQPMDKQECRAKLGITESFSPRVRNVLMFAALQLNNYRKGGDMLVEALQGLPDSLKAETALLTIGQGSAAMQAEVFQSEVGMETHHLGYVHQEERKALAYNAADLFLCPTRADNLPLVLLESMACGTPMVSFAVGGVSDLVRPGITGYLAERENAADFRAGIVQLLEDERQRREMSARARAIALDEYRRELQIERTIQLYTRVLDNAGSRRLSGRSNRTRHSIRLRTEKGGPIQNANKDS